MKKIINVKEVMIIIMSVFLITVISTQVLAYDPNTVLGGNNNQTQISGNEYQNAQTVPDGGNGTTEGNNVINNTTNNTVNNTVNNTAKNNTSNNTKVYNTNSKTDLPQTGIEDYNIGILLVICVASAIYAYKKINDYRNI